MTTALVTALLICSPIVINGVDKLALRCEGAIQPKEVPVKVQAPPKKLPPLGPPKGQKYLIMYTEENSDG